MHIGFGRLAPALACAALPALFVCSASAQIEHEIVIQVSPAAAAAHGTTTARRAALNARLADYGLLVRRAFTERLDLALATASASSHPFDLDPHRVWLVEAADSLAAARALGRLATHPEIDWAEPNALREPAWQPDDPLFQDGRQWGLFDRSAADRADVRAIEAWNRSRGSNRLRLAIADTGVDPNHPDLGGLMPDGRSRWVDPINVTSEPSGSWADSLGHGTPVAGVMAARSGEGTHFDSLGVAGVCGGDGPFNAGCRLIPIKITPGRNRGASTFDIARAIVHATDAGARAMNLSFVGTFPSRLERQALYYAITRGCVVVAASGNYGYSAGERALYPAAYAADGLCIQVGASDRSNRRAIFSSYGPGLDLVAPGIGIWSTSITYPAPSGATTDGYVSASGTSFAAPFVTGAVGLLCALRPELRDTDLQNILRESAADIGPPGVDAETGWGRLDAGAALAAVDPSVGIWHDEVAADRIRVLHTDTLTIDESGPGHMSVTRGRPARLIEVSATVALPDSFRGAYRVWPRIGGTMTLRGGFDLPYFAPWAEVVEHGPRAFTLRGFVYDTGAGVVPLPIDQARFGFTVLGPVMRPVAVHDRPAAAALRAAPNPFRHRLQIHGPRGAEFSILDLSGRTVRRLSLDATVGAAIWDGRDRRGQDVPPGLYFLRCRTATRQLHGKVLKLE